MKKNQMPLLWIISSIYTMVKETNTQEFCFGENEYWTFLSN